ncbi:MAG: class I SAM-dependent methyltransferase [Symploca sp. SIO2D2]|nr:class I SAM-dependent methyltransferase [Symploca sp. SIO2D2]
MENPQYAYTVFKKHFDLVDLEPGFVSLELGPGRSLASAILSKIFGASEIYLVDVGDFATKDISFYQQLLPSIAEQDTRLFTDIQRMTSLEEVLSLCSAKYMTKGLSSLCSIPDQSVDFIWSQAVLEHIRKRDFLATIQQLRRIVSKDGICSHRVDLRDHLQNSLNNLRFEERIWESEFMANSGFYTNRIQFSQMINLFKQAGFDVEIVEVNRWTNLPLSRDKLSKQFANISDEELSISGFSVILRPV